jgi:hypothetical protein
MYKLPVFIDGTEYFKYYQPYINNFINQNPDRYGERGLPTRHAKNVLFHDFNCTFDDQSFNKDLDNLQFKSEAAWFLLRFS